MRKGIDIGRRLSRIGNKMRRIFDGAFADSEITGTQASIIHFLARETARREVFQRDVELEFDIRRSSVSSVIGGLEKKGFIRRESVAEDARLKKIVLTDRGRGVSSQVAELIEWIDGELTGGLDDDELVILDRLLAKVQNNLS